MKKSMFFLIVSICFLFITFNNSNSVNTSFIQDDQGNSQFNVLQDVTSRYEYRYDQATGRKIGLDAYVINNSDRKLRVWYWFEQEGQINVFISYNGGYADLAPGAEEWAATVTVAVPTKAWNTGKFRYKWEDI